MTIRIEGTDAEGIQFDPALKQVLLRKTGALTGAVATESALEEIPVVLHLADPTIPVPGLRVVASFGNGIVTGRVPLGRIVEVRGNSNVRSLKAAHSLQPALAHAVPEINASPESLRSVLPSGLSGRGVVLGFADWGCDFAHANFRDHEGQSRILYLWDQRGGPSADSPLPFGYGRELSQERINQALGEQDPYLALDYDPADADPDGSGSHGTHVMDIAAGNGSAPGAAPGVAPGADLIFVHLMQDDTQVVGTLGDSVRLLEAIRYMVDRAGDRPLVVNCSLGRTIGPHTGTTPVELGLDGLLDDRPGTCITLSTGNYFGLDMHANGSLTPGVQRDLEWFVAPRNDEIAEMDIWYSGTDTFEVEVIDPTGQRVIRAALGESRVVRDDDRIIVSVHHRRHDPNSGDNEIGIFLWPDAMLGTWITRLHALAAADGRFHAWIERDDPAYQSRFSPGTATQTTTTGTICNGRRTIAVGAYDARVASHPLLPVSSSGPTRDDRAKPDISAPGVGIRAARSSSPGGVLRETNGLTTKSGTSMASPCIGGVVALMFEAAGNERLSAREVHDILTQTARRHPPDEEEQHLRYGAGRVDALAAVAKAADRRRTTATTQARPAERSNVTESMGSLRERGEEMVAMSSEPIQVDVREILVAVVPVLHDLLVEFGDAELGRVDEQGVPIYDSRQPLLFAPSGRRYSLSAGQLNYHAANFVYNTAYQLGYEVPVYPFRSEATTAGTSYYNTGATFDALARAHDPETAAHLRRFFDVVADPGQLLENPVKRGDLLVRQIDPGSGLGHIAIIVSPALRDMKDGWFTSQDDGQGKGFHCISAGVTIQRVEDRFGRRATDESGRVLRSRMILRFKDQTMAVQRVAKRLREDADYRDSVRDAIARTTNRSLLDRPPLTRESQPGAAEKSSEPAEAIIVTGLNYPEYHRSGSTWTLRKADGGWRTLGLRRAKKILSAGGTRVTLFDFFTGTRETVSVKGGRLSTSVDETIGAPDMSNFRRVDDTSGGLVKLVPPESTVSSADQPHVRYFTGASEIATATITAEQYRTAFYSPGASPPREKSISTTNLYRYLESVGSSRSGAITQLHIFSHAWAGGPILVNSADLGDAGASTRDRQDKDGRAEKDFKSANLDLAKFSKAFAKGARSWIWGCNAVIFMKQLILATIRQQRAAKSKVAAIFQYAWTPDWVESEDTFHAMLGGSSTDHKSDNKTLSDIVKIVSDTLDATYMKGLANASMNSVLGGLPGTYSDFDADETDEADRFLHIPMGSGDACDDDVDFRGVVRFYRENLGTSFDTTEGCSKDFGRGYGIFSPSAP